MSGSTPDADASMSSVEELAPELVPAVVSGLAFEAFYRREYVRIVALARVLAGPAMAEDLAQEAMLVAFRRWREVSAMVDPAMWVRRVCANMATSSLRRRGAEARAILRVGPRRHRVVELGSDDESLWEELRRLPRRQAQVMALHYIYDLSVADTAQTLGMREGTAKAHLFRGRTTLAQRLVNGDGDAS